MKKYLTILLCLLSFIIKAQTTYYIDPNGSDATGNGTVGNPWKTLRYASLNVGGIGDIIHVDAGSYLETQPAIIAVGVSVEGVGSASHIINTYKESWPGSYAHDGALTLVSTVEGTNGNQHISNLVLDGSNLTGNNAIMVRCRSNVSIHDVTIKNFFINGICFIGSSVNEETKPITYSINNTVYNCTIDNCSDMDATYNGEGLINFSGEKNHSVHDCILSDTSRAAGHNGDIVLNDRWGLGFKYYNNISYKPSTPNAAWNFHLEFDDPAGGQEIYSNTFYGGDQQIDYSTRGSYDYTQPYMGYVHGNTFIETNQMTDGSHGKTVLTLEGTAVKNIIFDNNKLINCVRVFSVGDNGTPVASVDSNIVISNNVGINMGLTLPNSYQVFMTINKNVTGGTLQDLKIINNTFVPNDTVYSTAIGLANNNGCVIKNMVIGNNILMNGRNGYWFFLDNTGGTFDTLTLRNNDLFNNPNGNSISSTGNPVTNVTNSKNISSDPLFVSPQDPHLRTGSPCIGTAYNYGYGSDIGGYQTTVIAPAPKISMSGNQVITATSTTISASATWASGHSGTYKWSQTAGTTATIVSSTSASTTVSSLAYGNSTFKCVITQDDGQKDSGYVSVFVKTPATLSYTSDTTQTYNGSPRSVTVITSPSGISGVNTTYAGLATSPTNAGIYPLVSSLTNSTYYASNITGTLTINKASATITVSNTTQTYTGSPLAVTASVSPAISGLSITYNGSSTAPTNAGTYTVIAKLTNSNYQATPDTVTFTINKATPTVSWATPSSITYGTALSGTQLNATASVAGAFTYTPTSGTILNAGTQLLSVNFTPTDGTNYNSVNNTTVSLVVNKATATITLSNLNQSYDGTPKPVTVTTSPVGLTVITTTYNGSTTVPSAIGSYPVNASLNNSNYTATPATGTLVISSNAATIYITNYSNLVYNGNQQTPTITCAYSYAVTYNGSGTPPTNVGSYTVIATINDGIHTGADTVTMTIIKATPVINWSNPNAVTYGTALSGTQLNASSTVAGTFVYTPVSGTILNAGTYVLSTAFTPTDASNYNSATATVNLIVNQATATISASNFSQVYDGTPKPITASVSPSVSGLVVTYNGSTTPPTNANSYAVNVSLNNPNYTATVVTGTLIILKVTPVLSWSKPAQITEGTPLSSTQLNATSDVAGSFTYSYPTGTVLSAGTYSMTATFTPSDTTNYNSGTVATSITVVGNPFNDFFISSGKIIWKPQ